MEQQEAVALLRGTPVRITAMCSMNGKSTYPNQTLVRVRSDLLPNSRVAIYGSDVLVTLLIREGFEKRLPAN